MDPIELVSREEWYETNGLTEYRENKTAGLTRVGPRVLTSTDDRVINAQNELGVSLEPGNTLGVYREAATKPVNPLDAEVGK